jgi:tellurium resistance protein TerD
MAVNLNKGGEVSLSKEAPGLAQVQVGLGWDPIMTSKSADLDLSLFLLNSKGKVSQDLDFIFYNNKFSADGSVEGPDDDRTGGTSDGDDDEVAKINLGLVSAHVETITIAATIHGAAGNIENFGEVENAYIRVVNEESGEEIVRYDLTGDYSRNNGVVLGEIYRSGATWSFRAIGDGYSAGLMGICKAFGVNVG